MLVGHFRLCGTVMETFKPQFSALHRPEAVSPAQLVGSRNAAKSSKFVCNLRV